ncbi:MAG: hypothetical protein FJX73_11410 [Armatimonadetes bacterium]|nr:hypothetical protein [Armatimonadota bacterium]
MKSARILAIAIVLLAGAMAIPAVVSAQGMWGPGMHWGYPGQPRSARVVTIDQAATLARQMVARYGNRDLVATEIMEFANHLYVVVAEKSTGVGAFELIVERNGWVRPEPGPNMMWNLKYGHMAGWGGGGMMGGGMMGGWGAPTGQSLTRNQARQAAQGWLNQAFPGAKAEEGMPFYGYFTFDFERGGKVVGMLSVRASTGQVWYHTWHGTFVREKELK